MVIVVNPGDSIQTAVNNAGPGFTILVRAGIYRESVIVGADRRGLRIIGEGPGETILDGSMAPVGSFGFRVQGSHFVTISGFTVRNFPTFGIWLETNDNIVRGNVVSQNGQDGVHIDSSRNLVQDNRVIQSDNIGIFVDMGEFNYLISNNVSRSGEQGILVGSLTEHTLVYGNDVSNNGGDGIAVSGDGSWIIENRLSANADDGIEAGFVANVLMYGNRCLNNSGAGLEATGSGLVAIGNVFNRNTGDGILVPSTLEEAFLFSNQSSNNGEDGLEGTSALTLSLLLDNELEENGNGGIDLNGGDQNRVLFNEVEENNNAGIDLDLNSDGNVVDNNEVEENKGSGIRLDDQANNNLIRSNDLEDNKPFDIDANLQAAGSNTLDLNECDRSSPSGLCE